jgi:hypothetical protein
MISGVRFTKEQLNVTRRAHRGDRRADRRVRLHEEHVEGLGVRVQAGFDHVAAVIGALTKDAHGVVTGDRSSIASSPMEGV